jgi:Fur family peroxide stress response transcriptional regulator
MISDVRKRATRQLAAVYEVLQGDHSHPSADEIYRRVRKKLPRISLGTVYRNLQRLVQERKIRMFLLGERVARYDPVVEEHDHFICQHCKTVEDVLLERDRRVNLDPLLKEGFTVTAHSLAIHGLCQRCGQKKSETLEETSQREQESEVRGVLGKKGDRCKPQEKETERAKGSRRTGITRTYSL